MRLLLDSAIALQRGQGAQLELIKIKIKRDLRQKEEEKNSNLVENRLTQRVLKIIEGKE